MLGMTPGEIGQRRKQVRATFPSDWYRLPSPLTASVNAQITRIAFMNVWAAVFVDNMFNNRVAEEQAICESLPICTYGGHDLILRHAQPIRSATDGGAQLSRNAWEIRSRGDCYPKTTDTKEQAFLPGIWLRDKDGKQSNIKSIGVDTVFAVSAVLKGDATVKQFTLHHYREAQISTALDGPDLVSFDPLDMSKRSS